METKTTRPAPEDAGRAVPTATKGDAGAGEGTALAPKLSETPKPSVRPVTGSARTTDDERLKAERSTRTRTAGLEPESA
jgi:hypothetical protein